MEIIWGDMGDREGGWLCRWLICVMEDDFAFTLQRRWIVTTSSICTNKTGFYLQEQIAMKLNTFTVLINNTTILCNIVFQIQNLQFILFFFVGLWIWGQRTLLLWQRCDAIHHHGRRHGYREQFPAV